MSKDVYVGLDGIAYFLNRLDAEERRLFGACARLARRKPDWGKYGNYWLPKVDALYSARGLSRREIIKTPVYQIAQDMQSRLTIEQDWAAPADYRAELRDLIETQFHTRREFCKATGLSEDMVSHVLAGRKNLSLETLGRALKRIGYRLRIAPGPGIKGKR